MLRNFVFFFVFTIANIQLWAQDLNFKIKKTLSNKAKVECLMLSKDGKMLISGDHAGDIKFWSIPDGQLLFSFKAHNGEVNCIALSQSGNKLVTAGSDGKVKLWSVAGKKLMNSFDSPYSSVNFVDITHNERTIYYGGYNSGSFNDGVFTGLWKIDIQNNKQAELFTDNVSMFSSNVWGITDGAIDPTGKFVIFTKGFNIYIWNILENKMESRLSSRFNLNNLLISKDGNLYLWGEGMIILREKNTNYSPKYTAAGTYSTIDYYSHLSLSQSGQYLATGSDKNNINIWSASNLAKQKTLVGHNGLVQVIQFAQNDQLLISGAYDGNIIFWENIITREEPPVIQQTRMAESVAEIVVDSQNDTVKEPASSNSSSKTVFGDKNIPTSVYGRPVEMQSEIKVHQQKIELKVWDEFSEDGDIVSVSLNGEWILQNYTLRKEPKTIEVHLKEGNNYLVLYAHNLGEVPPNSAAISTEINRREHKLTISSDLKMSGALNIIYQPLKKI